VTESKLSEAPTSEVLLVQGIPQVTGGNGRKKGQRTSPFKKGEVGGTKSKAARRRVNYSFYDHMWL